MTEHPCHAGPKDQWCDRFGAGGFMGHTCDLPKPAKLTRDELLILLIEECGEVIQAATKCLRFGFDSDHGIGYGLNSQVLSKECGDVLAIMDALPLCHISMEATRGAKIAKAEAAKERYGVCVGGLRND